MKSRYILNILLAGIIGLSSCSEYLEPDLDNQRSPEQVWSDPDYAQGVLNTAYQGLPKLYTTYGNDILDCATDNAVSNNVGSSVRKMALGAWTSNSNPINDWSGSFGHIRNINMFLNNGFDVTYFTSSIDRDQNYKDRLRGEAYFLRAYFSFNLLQRHAGKSADGTVLGYPIVKEDYQLNKAYPRSIYEQCVRQILSDLDTAKKYLPAEYTGSDADFGEGNIGRATSVAAQALASNVTLYASSPAFYDANSSGLSRVEAWARAVKKAQMLIDEIGNLPSWSDDLYWDDRKGEPIMRTYSNNRDIENKNYPPSLNGKGLTNPTQNLADAFPMENGYPIDAPESGYDPANPYVGRDKRFYATIIHNGAILREHTVETYEGGADTETNYNYSSRTGYYLRKFLNPNVNLTPGSANNARHYRALFRKVEAYLNYAEAANEMVGPNAVPPYGKISALEAIQKIRSRAGITSDAYLTDVAGQGQEAFRKLIHNERRIELAFENHRFFDLRRWGYTTDQLNTVADGIKITKSQDDTFTYETVEVEERAYEDYMLYGPIPYNEVLKGSNIEQNKGW